MDTDHNYVCSIFSVCYDCLDFIIIITTVLVSIYFDIIEINMFKYVFLSRVPCPVQQQWHKHCGLALTN